MNFSGNDFPFEKKYRRRSVKDSSLYYDTLLYSMYLPVNYAGSRTCLQSNGMDIKYRVIRVVEGTRRWDEASKFNINRASVSIIKRETEVDKKIINKVPN